MNSLLKFLKTLSCFHERRLLVNFNDNRSAKIFITSLIIGILPVTYSYAQVLGSAVICSSSPTTYTSIATTYGPLSPGTGNCGFPSGTYDPNYYAAIISADYQNGMACGACIDALDITTGGSVTVMVVDNCPSCSTANQLDLGPTAWNTLTDKAEELAPYFAAALKRKSWMKPLADHEIPVVKASAEKAQFARGAS